MNKLARLRTERGLTQQNLANLSGVHRVTIANLERGTKRIEGLHFSAALALASALNVDPRELIG